MNNIAADDNYVVYFIVQRKFVDSKWYDLFHPDFESAEEAFEYVNSSGRFKKHSNIRVIKRVITYNDNCNPVCVETEIKEKEN